MTGLFCAAVLVAAPGADVLPDNVAGGADIDLQRGMPRPAVRLHHGKRIGR